MNVFELITKLESLLPEKEYVTGEARDKLILQIPLSLLCDAILRVEELAQLTAAVWAQLPEEYKRDCDVGNSEDFRSTIKEAQRGCSAIGMMECIGGRASQTPREERR